MSAALYQSELTSIISESKRKNHDLRTAAEKALQDLKTITITSEQQLAADLAHKPSFVEPFLKACNTKASKLAISGVNGLQRLVISQGLPKDKLNHALQAFNACTELGLDVQLKVLQALPSLVQNYAEELQGDLLSSALQVCASLQGAKVSTVSAVAAATLQQLVTAVFSRLAREDQQPQDHEIVAEVPGETAPIPLRSAAYDAYRVFQDLVLAAENRAVKFVHLSTLSKEDCLELIESSIEAKPRLIANHAELASIIRSNVIPLVTTSITAQLSFSLTVRCIRIIRLLCIRHFSQFAQELDAILGLIPQALEPDSLSWKRVLFMELLRDIFAENGLIIMAYMTYDQDGKSIVQDIMASFVRLSSEKPALIGLGQQSTTPAGPGRDWEDSNGDARSGAAGVLGSLGVVDTGIQGISSQWSVPKSSCYDQLDKAEAPALPETYIYSLIMNCLHGLSESLAKAVLPLTVQYNQDDETASPTLPLNPLDLEDSPAVLRAKAVASLIETCWPAILATCSTFLNAALDDGFYRNLIKSYQRITQVAGLLRLSTPRDALMTTLGKSAVPPQVLNAASTSQEPMKSPTLESPRSFSNSMGLLSIESLVSQASSSLSLDKDARSSTDVSKPVLTVRNLLCLRALLNLAIALGPTLGSAFAVVVEVLKQADIVLSFTATRAASSNSTHNDTPSAVQAFSAEVSAVEQAASRLLESTADYPDDAFIVVLDAMCSGLEKRSIAGASGSPNMSPSPQPLQKTFPRMAGITSPADQQSKSYQFVLPKLATLAALNVSRFVTSSPQDSGWQRLTELLMTIAIESASPANARRSATDLLCKLSAECISAVSQAPDEIRRTIQTSCLALMLNLVRGLYERHDELSNLDLELQSHVIAALKAIIDRSGDTIIAGWDKMLALLSSAFESDLGFAASDSGPTTFLNWNRVSSQFRAARMGKEAFGTVQLICAEFFSLLPRDEAPSIIELLYRFMDQKDDLNLALTAITVVWNLSDLLFNDRAQAEDPYALHDHDAISVEEALQPRARASRTAQWLLLLAKLRQIVRSGHHELAKAAFQAICSISKASGAHVSTDIWTFVLRNILIGVLADMSYTDPESEEDLAPVLMSGTAEVLAQQIDLCASVADLDDLWSQYLDQLKKMLARAQLNTSCAVWQGLAQIFTQLGVQAQTWSGPIRETARLWSTHDPSTAVHHSKAMDNQPLFRAYTAFAAQVLRLSGSALPAELAYAIINNLVGCITQSSASFYGADVAVMTALQREVLDVLQGLPLNNEEVSSRIVIAVIDFATLHSSSQAAGDKPSFVALAVASIEWLQTIIKTDGIVIGAASIASAYSCLGDTIAEKYTFQVECKGAWLWRTATSAAVASYKPILALINGSQAEDETKVTVLASCVKIIRETALANGLENFDNEVRAYRDETEDISAFKTLSTALYPSLSSKICTNELQKSFAQACFEASIVHPLEKSEATTDISQPLRGLTKIRRGRVKKISPSSRERMSYQALTQLMDLALLPEEGTKDSPLAVIALDWLVLRLAIPLRAYIADQPLRSRMPQPLSEVEEMLFVLEQLKDFASVGTGSRLPAGGSEKLWSSLYPLLIQAVRVAGDKWCGSEVILLPLQDVLSSYMPSSL